MTQVSISTNVAIDLTKELIEETRKVRAGASRSNPQAWADAQVTIAELYLQLADVQLALAPTKYWEPAEHAKAYARVGITHAEAHAPQCSDPQHAQKVLGYLRQVAEA